MSLEFEDEMLIPGVNEGEVYFMKSSVLSRSKSNRMQGIFYAIATKTCHLLKNLLDLRPLLLK
jgi:hypothetical protein